MGVLSLRRQILMAQPHKETVVGDGIASFDTDFKANIPKIVIPFTPVQADGTPSPDNPLPISGWTGCEIKDSKDSFYKTAGTNPVINQYGVQLITNDSIRVYRLKGSSEYVSSKQLLSVYNLELGKTYCVSADATIVSGSARIAIRNSANSMKKSTNAVSSVGNHHLEFIFVYDNVEELNYLSFFATFGETSEGDVTYSNIKFSEVVALPITFTDPSTGDPMTIYGGTVTLNADGSADVVSGWGARVLNGSETWSPNTSYPGNAFYTSANSVKRKTNYLNTILCDKVKVCAGFTFQDFYNATEGITGFHRSGYSGQNWLYLRVNGITTATGIKKWLANNPIQVCYQLATPQTYHFDNVGQLKTFLGTNNVWSDLNGDPTVTFWKHG